MKRYLSYTIAIMIVAIAAVCAYAQDDASKAPAKETQVQGAPAQQTPAAAPPVAPMTPVPGAAQAPAAMPAKEEAPKMSDLSIYGEVQSVNVQANSMTVQYYDYDNDEEKSTEIALDSNSKLENAKAIGDIKKGDWVDVTYTASAGKNIAKAVSVEKEEPVQDQNVPTAEE